MTRAADNAEINLYYVTGRGDQPYLVLNECRPSTRANPLTGDPAEQERNFRRLVVRKLKEKIDLRFGPRSPAPLIESLATISRQRIVTSKIEQQTRVEFDIYSDMVQDSANASLSSAVRCTSTTAAKSPDFKGTYTDVKRLFRGLPVNVYALHRDAAAWPNYPGERCVRTFWEDVFPHLTWMTI